MMMGTQTPNTDAIDAVCTDAEGECKAKDPASCPHHGAKSGNKFSATGANKVPPMTSAAQQRHRKHLKSMGGISMDEYVKRGVELASKPVGGNIKGYRAESGAVVRYDSGTGEFAKGYSTGLATYFKPSGGAEYFERQIIKDGGTTDD